MPLIYNSLQNNNRPRRNSTSLAHHFRNRLLQRTFSSHDLNDTEDWRAPNHTRITLEEEVMIRRPILASIESNSSGPDSDDEEDDVGTFPHSPIDLYRLAIRSNSEILEDLTSIFRILRQMNAIHRIFNHSSNVFGNTGSYVETVDEEETNVLLETGLADLQSVLSLEHKRQSALALLALLTYQQGQHGCSDRYLRHYLDPNGEYNPRLAMFAAAICDDDDENHLQPRSCQDIMTAAEEMLGPTWLDEFHKEKGCMLRKMLEKLAFVAKIRTKMHNQSNNLIIR
ncbi:hypothetical protein G6F57_007817 [Rhizopus arrhizus]|uniref:Uncharacterized protein n=1 Tax=Rhizopus oryzae TaxID=64495 RepID=A0A9P7BRE1_RHIOR|nr:hypothetical protein G6F23_006134 [Rhizopus arrhizus]KAG1417420.1 hypothetical protein G6F58_005530 [Rhizopus delemar]KAG0761394.1 hypothetical protein G6F24_007601 [Rhizopus arrhizus]KAG0787815.1 hypothetical protein G6F21_007646 [Rhizopus arrhizus]KAG0798221.1 hypothetical protein G6F22_004439 [Rhizopus arrhizus]